MPGIGGLFKVLYKGLTKSLNWLGKIIQSRSAGKTGFFSRLTGKFGKSLRGLEKSRLDKIRWAKNHPWQAMGNKLMRKLTIATMIGGTMFALGRIFKGKGNPNSVLNPSDAAREPAFDIPPMAGVQQGALDPDQLNNLMKAMSAGNKSQRVTQVQQAIETAKADQMAYSKLLAKLPHFGTEGVPDKLQKIYAKGKDSGSKLDAIIELLNRQNDISNAHRITSIKIGNMKRAEDEAKADRATQLYQKLSVLHAQSMSANNDAVEAISRSSKMQTGMVMRQQAQQHKQVMAQAKQSSIFKWLLFGGILAGIGKLLGGFSGVANLLKSGFGAIWDGLGSVRDAIFGTTENITKSLSEKSQDRDLKTEELSVNEKELIDQSQKNAAKEASSKQDHGSEALMKGQIASDALKVTGITDKINAASASKDIPKLTAVKEAAETTKNKAVEAVNKSAYRTAAARANLDGAKKSNDPTKLASAQKEYDEALKLERAARQNSVKAKSAFNKASEKLSAKVELASKAGNKTAFGKAADKIKSSRLAKAIPSGIDRLGGRVLNTKIGQSIGKAAFRSKAFGKVVGAGIKAIDVTKAVAKWSGRLLSSIIGQGIRKAALKALSKTIPGLGIVSGLLSAGKRLIRGDLSGALMDAGTTTIAQVGSLFGPVGTIAGLGLATAGDIWHAKIDANKAIKFANKGDLAGVERLGYSTEDIASMIYNMPVDEDDPKKGTVSLPSDHPFRKAFESKYKSINDLIDGKGSFMTSGMDPVNAVILAQSLHDGPLKKDYDAHANSIEKLKKDKFSNSDILKIISSSTDKKLLKDTDKNFNYLDKVARSKDAWNNNATEQLGIIAKNMPNGSEFKKQFISKYGDPDKYIASEHKRKDHWYKKVVGWGESAQDWVGDKMDSLFRAVTGNSKKIRYASGTAQYADGTLRGSTDQALEILQGKTPKDAHPGGTAIVGDPIHEGEPDKPEIVMEPGSKSAKLVDHQQAGVYKKGTTVIPVVEEENGTPLTSKTAKKYKKNAKIEIKPHENKAVIRHAKGTGELEDESNDENPEDEELEKSPVQQYAVGTLNDSDTRKMAVMSYLVNKGGLTPVQAAGIVGNMMQESRLTPNIQEKGGGGYGLAQWTGPRRRNLVSFLSHYSGEYGSATTGKSSLGQQLDFLMSELNGAEKVNWGSVNTPADSARIFLTKFERANWAKANGQFRQSQANAAYNLWNANKNMHGLGLYKSELLKQDGSANADGDTSGSTVSDDTNDNKSNGSVFDGSKPYTQQVAENGGIFKGVANVNPSTVAALGTGDILKGALGLTGDLSPKIDFYDTGTVDKDKKWDAKSKLNTLISTSNKHIVDGHPMTTEYGGKCTHGPNTFYKSIGIDLNGHWWEGGDNVNTKTSRLNTVKGPDGGTFNSVWTGTRDQSVTVDDLNSHFKDKKGNPGLRPGDIITIFGTKRNGQDSSHAMMWNGHEILSDALQGNKIWVYPKGRGVQTIVWRYSGFSNGIKDFDSKPVNVNVSSTTSTQDGGQAGSSSPSVKSDKPYTQQVAENGSIFKGVADVNPSTVAALGTAMNRISNRISMGSPSFSMATAKPSIDEKGAADPELSPSSAVETSINYNPVAAVQSEAPAPVSSPVTINGGNPIYHISYIGPQTTNNNSSSAVITGHKSDPTRSAK